jgi:hypothetical protein
VGLRAQRAAETPNLPTMSDSTLRTKAAATLAHALENFPEPIVVPPGLPAEDWRRTIDRGLHRNRQARLAAGPASASAGADLGKLATAGG